MSEPLTSAVRLRPRGELLDELIASRSEMSGPAWPEDRLVALSTAEIAALSIMWPSDPDADLDAAVAASAALAAVLPPARD